MFDQMKGGMFQGRVRRDAFIIFYQCMGCRKRLDTTDLHCARLLVTGFESEASLTVLSLSVRWGVLFGWKRVFFEGHESCFLTQVRCFIACRIYIADALPRLMQRLHGWFALSNPGLEV